jgi:hypothetical protein
MAMLSARALSDACRYAAPSVLAGVYDPEELATIEPQQSAQPAPRRSMLGAQPQPVALPEVIDAQPEPQPVALPVLPESRRVAYLRRLADLGLVEQAVAVLGDPSTWTAETAERIGGVVKDLQATRPAASGGEE